MTAVTLITLKALLALEAYRPYLAPCLPRPFLPRREKFLAPEEVNQPDVLSVHARGRCVLAIGEAIPFPTLQLSSDRED